MKNDKKSNGLIRFTGKGLLLGMFLGMVFTTTLFAQLEVTPLGILDNKGITSPTKSARVAVLNLPFFDDFSTATLHPDNALWVPGSGVYINNTLTTKQPSINVATFDGLNSKGVPYNFTNEQAQGDSDTLTSQPINLTGLVATDSIYLSYYWQARGLGELPDGSDTFRLEFLNQLGDWITVWKKGGSEFSANFQQSFIKITNPAFLHANFQFRFRAFGRLSGAFDTWHLDYIYLNKKRLLTDRFIKDIAVRKPLTSLLKRYTAMPFKHYFARPELETADSVRTDIVNLFNNFNFTSFTFTIYDELGRKEVQRFQEPVSAFIQAQNTQPKSIKIRPITKPDTGSRMRLKYKFDLLTTDDQNPTIPTVNLRRNDTISAYTDLSDYYAYDDGGAEFGVRMNQRLGRTAVRFTTQVRDTLGGVRMAIVPFRKDLSGQGFTIQVWSNLSGKPDRVIYQKSVPLNYAADRNGFVEYVFDNGVAVSDTFYVGWLQISQDALSVGLDRNSELGSKQLFSNLSQEWVKNTEIKGSVMIRPFFGGKASSIITGEEPALTSSTFVYPNPTNGLIRWSNESLKQIDIFTLQGTKVRTEYPSGTQRETSLAELSEGVYVLRLTDGVRVTTQKIVIKK
jgi:hypothetical protein